VIGRIGFGSKQLKGGKKMPKRNEKLDEAKAEAERLRLEVMRLTQKIEIALSILGKKEE